MGEGVRLLFWAILFSLVAFLGREGVAAARPLTAEVARSAGGGALGQRAVHTRAVRPAHTTPATPPKGAPASDLTLDDPAELCGIERPVSRSDVESKDIEKRARDVHVRPVCARLPASLELVVEPRPPRD